ncbi:MAG: EF-P beta-lysylation protein EpmB [Planctomycetia bacterium]|nr:EF-P beta-lysylation protein EpmB [Planctomycetia bacterium]
MANPTTEPEIRGEPCHAAAWQAVLADAIRDPSELRRLLDLPPGPAAPEGRFPMLVPRPYLARIRRSDPQDPLLLQILPRPEESIATPRFSADPLGESAARRGPGLLGKYPGRSLIVTTGVCAVHCRFCFRRHFPYPSHDAEPEALDQAVRQIAADTSLGEVILSGGDPLTLTDCRLAELSQRLARIGHLRRLRVHTRMPIVIPQRVTPELISWLRGTRLTPIMVVHVNHPAEIDTAVADALGRLVDAGVAVLSQTVLLRAVNDRVDVLAELCQRLVDLRVMPYYLHQLDRVAGAAHFEVPEARGRALVAELRARLPGYAVPRYVREVPEATSKIALA